MTDVAESASERRGAVPGASEAPCEICSTMTLDRVVVGDGVAPICSATCELAFANRRASEAKSPPSPSVEQRPAEAPTELHRVCLWCTAEQPENAIRHLVGVGYSCIDRESCRRRRRERAPAGPTLPQTGGQNRKEVDENAGLLQSSPNAGPACTCGLDTMIDAVRRVLHAADGADEIRVSIGYWEMLLEQYARVREETAKDLDPNRGSGS